MQTAKTMLQMLSQPSTPAPRLPPGQRLYAIGDVHGRLDLVRDLLARIRSDGDARGAARTTLVFLGDLIDRGPDSSGVVDLLMNRVPWASLVCLKGNHEAAMLDALAGDDRAAAMWLRVGGIEALASWGVSADLLRDGDAAEIMAAARDTVPADHRRWLAARPISYRMGDYYLVHAGLRPGVPIEMQSALDSMWIREPFLRSRKPHGPYVVHGHTVTGDIDVRANRIGLDTGAYGSGKLSAVGLEGADRWFLQTGGN